MGVVNLSFRDVGGIGGVGGVFVKRLPLSEFKPIIKASGFPEMNPASGGTRFPLV